MAVRTPLVHSSALSELASTDIYLKLENRQPTGAFKLRGAWTFISRLSDQDRAGGVITYSSGNHGQAVAYAARRLATRAVVVMPESAPAIKVEGVRRWGGEVEFAGTTSEDRYERAMEIAASQGLSVVPPYDHPDIIAGQGTVGLEIVEDLPDVAHVVVPVGGGGLIAGVTTAVLALRPDVTVTGVEPDGAATFAAALSRGAPVRLECTRSVADGLLPLSVGVVTFNHLRGRAEAVQVSDVEIAASTVWLRNVQGVLAEPSGAVTTAAVQGGHLSFAGPCVLIVSGGNVNPELVDELASTYGIE